MSNAVSTQGASQQTMHTENPAQPPYRHRVVIVGAGFGGLHAAQAFSKFPSMVEVILIDRENHHLFQPLLYQVATGALSDASIAVPLRTVLHKKKNVWLRKGNVRDFDLSRRLVHLDDGDVLFDTLILAAGATTSYFGHTDWKTVAPPLKTLHDAHRIRGRVLDAFEKAEWETNAKKRESLMSFAIVGGGPTGVELAGAIAELARGTSPHEFINIDTTSARVMLFHGGDRLLDSLSDASSVRALKMLQSLGVEVHLNRYVTHVHNNVVVVKGEGSENRFIAATILWAAGTEASNLGKMLANQLDVEVEKKGAVPVDSNLHVAGHPSVYAIGDVAHFETDNGFPLPGLAPVATQQGRHVAAQVIRTLKNKPLKRFRYRDKGNLATVGHRFAVGEVGRFSFSGVWAWFFWAMVHLYFLIGFENRLLVFIQWAFNYFTQNRDARLILTNHDKPDSPDVLANNR